MVENPKPTELLDRKAGRVAGAMSVLLGLCGLAAIVAWSVGREDESALLTGLVAGKIGLLVIICAAGVQLIRGHAWAQRLLLVVWLGGLASAITLAVAGILWGTPSWWFANWSMVEVLAPAVILEALAVVLLVRAATGGSRLRYGTNVAISIAAALALVAVVNLFAQKDRNYRRIDVETLQRYSLSDRTKRILDSVDTPVRLTCLYTAVSDKPDTPDRRARLMELLEEMHEHKRQIEIVNVTSDAGKARLIERLGARSGGATGEHARLIERFRGEGPKIAAFLAAEQQRWEQVAGKSYLDQWGLAAEVWRLLKTDSEQLQKVAAEVNEALSGRGIVEHAKLVESAERALTTAQETLEKITGRMEQVIEIAPAIRTNRAATLESADEAIAVVKGMGEAVGEVGTEAPSDPAAALQKFIEACDGAAEQIMTTTQALDETAGKQYAPFIRTSQAWLVQGGGGMKVLPDGRVILLGRSTVTDLYTRAVRTIERLKLDAENFRRAAKPEYQVKMLKQFRKAVSELSGSMTAGRSAVEEAIDQLGKVDPPTQELLTRAKGGAGFQEASDPIAALLETIEDLPELEESSLADDITGENILLVEVGRKAAVVDFETIWPLKVRTMGPTDPEDEKKRNFDGDSAISSKILSLTHEPFATVLLTHYRPEVSPQTARMVPQAEISPTNLSALRTRLEEANFEVREWNVTGDRPESDDPNRPQVMLVLPPPFIPPMGGMRGGPQIPPFGPEHMTRISAAIDEGIPAVFLAKYFIPRPVSMWSPPVDPPYPPGDYLRTAWGIDVRTNYLVIPTVPDDRRPGKFLIALSRFGFLPLSTFSDHAIGRNLQGQRTLWSWLAPIVTATPLPEGVTVEPLLSVPGNWTDTWATSRFRELIGQLQGNENSFVTPDYEMGDLRAPFDVAVAATRTASDQTKPARIVALGAGAGMVDGYLDSQIPVLKGDALTLTDPPRTNADVVINSVYWLIGRERYIARGPTRVTPIAMIPRGKLTALWILCVVALPALILALGGVVLFFRRR